MKKSLGLLILIFITMGLVENSFAAGDGKKVNLWVNALGFTYGATDGGIDFKVADHFTVGPAGIYLKTSSGPVSLTATGYGAYINYYFSGAIKSSFRLSALGYFIPMEITSGAAKGTFESTAYGGLFGYHWVPGIITVFLGAGGIYYSTSGTVTLTDKATGRTSTVTTPGFSGFTTAYQVALGLAF